MSAAKSNNLFTKFAKKTSMAAGRPITFGIAVATIVVWGISGPVFGFSDTWQLIINTGTTIVTFLMVFLIQNTQNRDSEAIQVKLDELLRVTEGAHIVLLDLEEMEEKDLEEIRQRYVQLAARAREQINDEQSDWSIPEAEEPEHSHA